MEAEAAKLIGAGLAAAAGIMYGLYYGSVKYDMGFVPGIKAFTAAVLGGIGSIPGAALGGLFLGVIEAVGPPLLLEGLAIPGAQRCLKRESEADDTAFGW